MWAMLFPEEELPAAVWKLDAGALHELALQAAGEFHPVLRRLVERADVDYTIAVALSAARRPKEWPVSRATLMGDAVHVMPPLGAHGGNTALRDAALLADKLLDMACRGEPVEQAVKMYQQEMIGYAFQEVEGAMAMLRRSTTTNQLVRWAMLRAVPWLRSTVGSAFVLDSDRDG